MEGESCVVYACACMCAVAFWLFYFSFLCVSNRFKSQAFKSIRPLILTSKEPTLVITYMGEVNKILVLGLKNP